MCELERKSSKTLTQKKNPLNYEEAVDRVRILDRAIKIVENQYGYRNTYAGCAYEDGTKPGFTLKRVEVTYRRLCSLFSE